MSAQQKKIAIMVGVTLAVIFADKYLGLTDKAVDAVGGGTV